MIKMIRKSYASIEYQKLKGLLGIEAWPENDVAAFLVKKNFSRPAGDDFVYLGG